MKTTRPFIVYLIIGLLFQAGASSQTLTLEAQGATAAETAIIDSLTYTQTHASYQEVAEEAELLFSKLLDIGYVDAKRSPLLQQSDSLWIAPYALGNPYLRMSLTIPKENTLRNYLTKSGITIEGDSISFNTAFAKALLEALTLEASNDGKPFSSFQIKGLQKEKNGTLSGHLTYQPDPTRYITGTVVKGYPKMPKAFITRYAGFKKGLRFNRADLLAKQEALQELPFIQLRKDLELQFTKDSTTVYLYIERRPTNTFDGFLGFSNDAETNQLVLDGYLDLVLINNLNYGERLTLNYKSDGNDQSQLRVQTELPYLFGSPLGVQAQLHLFRKDTTFSENSQEASVFYQWSSRLRVEGGYKRKTSDNLLDDPSLMTDIIDYTSDRVTLGSTYQERSSEVLFPEKYFFQAGGEFGERQSDSLNVVQRVLHATARARFDLNKTNQIYVQSRTQWLDSDTYVTNELFRFGGITSIRGFEENSIFANLVSVLNTEYRYLFNSALYIHSIIDLAYFENELFEQHNKLISFGLGAGIVTKAGLFKVNIANGRQENQEFKFSNTKVHLQLITRF